MSAYLTATARTKASPYALAWPRKSAARSSEHVLQPFSTLSWVLSFFRAPKVVERPRSLFIHTCLCVSEKLAPTHLLVLLIGWEWREASLFCISSLSTNGYGSVAPSKDYTKVFFIFFLLFVSHKIKLKDGHLKLNARVFLCQGFVIFGYAIHASWKIMLKVLRFCSCRHPNYSNIGLNRLTLESGVYCPQHRFLEAQQTGATAPTKKSEFTHAAIGRIWHWHPSRFGRGFHSDVARGLALS